MIDLWWIAHININSKPLGQSRLVTTLYPKYLIWDNVIYKIAKYHLAILESVTLSLKNPAPDSI